MRHQSANWWGNDDPPAIRSCRRVYGLRFTLEGRRGRPSIRCSTFVNDDSTTVNFLNNRPHSPRSSTGVPPAL